MIKQIIIYCRTELLQFGKEITTIETLLYRSRNAIYNLEICDIDVFIKL